MGNLADELNVRAPVNVVCDGQLIEIFRGSGEFEKVLPEFLEKFEGFSGQAGGFRRFFLHENGRVGHAEANSIMYVARGNVDVNLVASSGEPVKIEQGQKFDLIGKYSYDIKSQTDEAELWEFTNRVGVERVINNGEVSEFPDLSSLLDEIGGVEQVTRHIFPHGKIGGNHYHKDKKREIIAVMRGRIDVYDAQVLNPETGVTGDVFFFFFSEGECFELLLGEVHALHNSYEDYAEILEFSNMAFNPAEPKHDVYQVKNCLVSGKLLRG